VVPSVLVPAWVVGAVVLPFVPSGVAEAVPLRAQAGAAAVLPVSAAAVLWADPEPVAVLAAHNYSLVPRHKSKPYHPHTVFRNKHKIS